MDPTMNAPSSLTDFYDNLKQAEVAPKPAQMIHVPAGDPLSSPAVQVWRNKAVHHSQELKDKCCKHLVLDIYCKILPLDEPYKDGHMGQMKQDVDSMLATKGMSPSQYLTSCYEATEAPLLEFLLRSCSNIAKAYMEEADKEIKDAAEEDGTPLPPEPEKPDEESEDVASQLVDIKQDPEYENFVEKLKKKTINKIVKDVSDLIVDKKHEDDMSFKTTPANQFPESAVRVGMDYLQKQFWAENKRPDQETMIGMAIREATMHELDLVFNQPLADMKKFESAVAYGHGVVINPAAVAYLKESMQ